MKRGKPLARRTPLRAKTALKRMTEIRQRSKKREKFMREDRVPRFKRMQAESPYCELGSRIKEVSPGYMGCTIYMEGLHELVKRSAGGSLTDETNLVRACNVCNGWVEDHVELARKAGLAIPASKRKLPPHNQVCRACSVESHHACWVTILGKWSCPCECQA